MKNLWDKYNWFFLLGAMIFSAGVAKATMTEIVERVGKLEIAYATVPSTLARIEQKVDDLRGIHGFTGDNR